MVKWLIIPAPTLCYSYSCIPCSDKSIPKIKNKKSGSGASYIQYQYLTTYQLSQRHQPIATSQQQLDTGLLAQPRLDYILTGNHGVANLRAGLPDLDDVLAVPWSSTIVRSSFAVDVLHWFVAVALFFSVFIKPVQFHSLHAAWHGTWLQLVWNNITTCAHAHSQPTGAGAPYLLPRPPPC